MATLSIPVRLSLAELSAAALTEAAANLATASDRETFITALDNNHHLWRTLIGVAHQQSWTSPDPRQAEFVMGVSRKCGVGVCDDHVEALIGINHRVSSQLAAGTDLCRITSRATLAWRESELTETMPFHHWLVEEILRKARHHDSAKSAESSLAATG